MVAAVVLFQSQRAENALTGEDESAIRGLLEVYGKNDSLSNFATRRDKSVVFAPTAGQRSPTASRSGVPGQWRPDRRPTRMATGHRRLARAVPGLWLGTRGHGREFDRGASLSRGRAQRLQLGDEAILYPDKFHLSGSDMRAVRPGRHPARRPG